MQGPFAPIASRRSASPASNIGFGRNAAPAASGARTAAPALIAPRAASSKLYVDGPDHGTSQRARLDQVLAAEVQEAAADDRDIARRVVGEHLAHGISRRPRARFAGTGRSSAPGSRRIEAAGGRKLPPPRRNAADGAARSRATPADRRLPQRARPNSGLLALASASPRPTPDRSAEASAAPAPRPTIASEDRPRSNFTLPSNRGIAASAEGGQPRRVSRVSAPPPPQETPSARRCQRRSPAIAPRRALRKPRVGEHDRNARALRLRDQARPDLGLHESRPRRGGNGAENRRTAKPRS